MSSVVRSTVSDVHRIASVRDARAARDDLAARSVEVTALVAQPSETGDLIDTAANRLTLALRGADQISAVPDSLLLEFSTVPTYESSVALDPVVVAGEELEASFAAWEQAIADTRAEREAQEAQASAEAELAARATQPSTSTPQPSTAAANYTVYPAGTGGQALVDTCAGPVWFESLPSYLAEHWHCGGASFPKNAGAIIDVAGVGTFVSQGVIVQLDGFNSTINDVPPGYDLYYQTYLRMNPSTTLILGLMRR
ncbi:hypothetical protein [Leucobacter sp. cx-169]|uniref:hypothetical protein n=1 Tax=Leucobacter sp. cx-169 TaxID=2770549 RepID=UPI00165E36A3|nr:hypothetical protein [Leucobacter sp. cx-169]MBC9927173.1 hypothetical protein [Leucobacter sp. cx-169]